MIINYSDYHPFDKPSIRLHFFNKGKLRFKLDALLDSGADLTSLPVSLSESIIGINLEKMTDVFLTRMGGIDSSSHCFCGKDIKSVMLPIEVQLEKFRFIIFVNWVFTDKVDPVIGRRDLFQCFNITFDELSREIRLIPHLEEIKKRQGENYLRKKRMMEQYIAQLSVR